MHINSIIRSLTIRLLTLALVMLALSAASFAQFRAAITIGPPALPVYEQPVCVPVTGRPDITVAWWDRRFCYEKRTRSWLGKSANKLPSSS
jgi:hypothetical protein